MSEEGDLLVDQLRALGEINRLRILMLLRQGELSVGELAQIMGQSQPRLSHHLKSLTRAGLVERLPEGSWVFFSLPIDRQLRRLIDSVLSSIDFEAGAFGRDLQQLAKVRTERALAAENFFSETAETWDTVRALHYPNAKIEAALLELVGAGPFGRMVDIGTGTGRMLTLFADRFTHADGIDTSHRMLTVARANLERDNVRNVNVRQSDAQGLPFADRCADLVTIHQVLHFIEEPQRVLAEAARILRPGGLLLICDFAPHNLEFLRKEHGHRRLGIRHEKLVEWLAETGLTAQPPECLNAPIETEDGLGIQIWAIRAPGVSQSYLQPLESSVS